MERTASPATGGSTAAGRHHAGPMWLIGASLAVIAVCMVLRLEERGNPVFAQPMGQAGALGIFAFTGQLSPSTHGLFMVDVDTMTVWCYEILGDSKELRLVAGRTWRYDRYLENFNCAGFAPEVIENMVQEARDAKLRHRGKP